MSHGDRNGQNERHTGQAGRARDREAAVASRGSAGPGRGDSGDRPGASGHRFGPDLACSECGILWDVHQREPKPCKTDVAPDVFSRRPTSDFGESSVIGAGDSAKATKSPAPTPLSPVNSKSRVPDSAKETVDRSDED